MDSTKRFSNRVQDYIKYRPRYPEEIISFLQEKNILQPRHFVADIGSGTGISTELFLKNENKVFAVEPNDEMRNAAEKLLQQYSNFFSIKGTAEERTLASASIDLIVAGQAFHWFDVEKAKKEFRRIARPSAHLVLMWNERLESSEFLREYEALIQKYATDYSTVDHRNISEEKIGDFFHPSNFVLTIFPNQQRFDFDGLKGRLLSSSYIPSEDHPFFNVMLDELQQLFRNHQNKNVVTIEYNTKVFYGAFQNQTTIAGS